MREGSGVGAQMWEGIGVKHCEVQVVRGGAGGQGPLKSNEKRRATAVDQEPASVGGAVSTWRRGRLKKWVWDVVGGGSEASRESKTRRSERMAGWFGCGGGSGRAR